MREIKFEYVFKNHDTGKVIRDQYKITSVEGVARDDIYYHSKRGYELEDRRQFTGLRDKNGVEIYEDDMLRDNSGKSGLVRYFESDARFEIIDLFEISINGIDCEVPAYEIDTSRGWSALDVIGNIHENPELLDDSSDE